MWPDRVSNPRPLALKSDALPTALRGAARLTTNSVDQEKAAHYEPPYLGLRCLQIQLLSFLGA